MLLWIPRALLFVPRWTLWALVQPARYALVLNERQGFYRRFLDIVFDDTGTYGAYPVVRFDRNIGASFGVRLVHRDLFRAGGGLRVWAEIGDRLRQDHGISFDTGRLLRVVALESWFGYRMRPREIFAGIGNADLTEVDTLAPLPVRLDALRDDVAVRTRYREDRLEGGVGVGFRLGRRLTLRLRQAFVRKWFFDGILPRDPWTSRVYDTASLPGFRSGVQQAESTVSLMYDTLRTTAPHVPAATPSRGWLLLAYHGISAPLRAEARYQRSGIDAARFIDLYRGDRVLRLRARFELVQGDDDEIPFSELATLGGADLLRGYPRGRFRDRLSVLGSVEYVFPVDWHVSGYLFSDVGRVYRGVEDLGFRGLRAGFGGGIQLHRGPMFIARVQVSTSIDGGLQINLRLQPSFAIGDSN